MSWLRPDQRPIVDWPNGRDWRCEECGHVKPEAEGKDPSSPDYGCRCGGPMSRVVVKL